MEYPSFCAYQMVFAPKNNVHVFNRKYLPDGIALVLVLAVLCN